MTPRFLLAIAISKGVHRCKLRSPRLPPAFTNCTKTRELADLAARWSAVSWRQSKKLGSAPAVRRIATPIASSAPADSWRGAPIGGSDALRASQDVQAGKFSVGVFGDRSSSKTWFLVRTAWRMPSRMSSGWKRVRNSLLTRTRLESSLTVTAVFSPFTCHSKAFRRTEDGTFWMSILCLRVLVVPAAPAAPASLFAVSNSSRRLFLRTGGPNGEVSPGAIST